MACDLAWEAGSTWPRSELPQCFGCTAAWQVSIVREPTSRFYAGYDEWFARRLSHKHTIPEEVSVLGFECCTQKCRLESRACVCALRGCGCPVKVIVWIRPSQAGLLFVTTTQLRRASAATHHAVLMRTATEHECRTWLGDVSMVFRVL